MALLRGGIPGLWKGKGREGGRERGRSELGCVGMEDRKNTMCVWCAEDGTSPFILCFSQAPSSLLRLESASPPVTPPKTHTFSPPPTTYIYAHSYLLHVTTPAPNVRLGQEVHAPGPDATVNLTSLGILARRRQGRAAGRFSPEGGCTRGGRRSGGQLDAALRHRGRRGGLGSGHFFGGSRDGGWLLAFHAGRTTTRTRDWTRPVCGSCVHV